MITVYSIAITFVTKKLWPSKIMGPCGPSAKNRVKKVVV